jgi:hypothetical protein
VSWQCSLLLMMSPYLYVGVSNWSVLDGMPCLIARGLYSVFPGLDGRAYCKDGKVRGNCEFGGKRQGRETKVWSIQAGVYRYLLPVLNIV